MLYTIDYASFDSYAYSNDKKIKGNIKGIVVQFSGLGANAMITDDNPHFLSTIDRADFYAKNGIIFFVPYLDPWCWMNKQAQETTDRLIEVLIDHYSLPADVPIVSTGGSMGGMSALVYTAYAKKTPVACVANCPVCDVPYHYTERPDLPRTFLSAYYNCGMTMDEALRAHSPLHIVDKMPDVDYYIFHCELDRAVNISAHSEKLVAELSKAHRVTFHRVPDRGHCHLTEEADDMFVGYVLKSIG